MKTLQRYTDDAPGPGPGPAELMRVSNHHSNVLLISRILPAREGGNRILLCGNST